MSDAPAPDKSHVCNEGVCVVCGRTVFRNGGASTGNAPAPAPSEPRETRLTREETERKLRLVPDLDMDHPFVGEVLDDIAALRAEVERLTREREDREAEWYTALRVAAQRVAHLEKAIRDAPHHYNCTAMECRRSHGHRTKPPCLCDCWKRAALEGK